MEQVVVAQGVIKSFDGLDALNGVDLTVSEGEVVCVIGPSGSGKSTFLRCINHLETIDQGTLLVDGEFVGYRRRGNELHELKRHEVAKRRAEIGMVFQDFNLFPHLNVLENLIEAPVRVRRKPKGEVIELAEEQLRWVGLQEKRDSYPGMLSGGQQQRVAIARALMMQPKLMLFDEPTSALDPELVGEVLTVIRRLAGLGMTMIIVTHEIGFARDAADKVVFMDSGRVIEQGVPKEILENPRQERTKAFLRSVTI